jgi:DNA-nicking Smr family endonuclease
MDFGDILTKWEKQGPNGTYDKDVIEENKLVSAQEKRHRLRNKKPDAEIDLHNYTKEDACLAMDNFFNESKEKGYEKILIIHGKGNHSTGEAVLKRAVMDFIEHCPFAGESGRGKNSHGGEGATWVLLKDN